MFAKWIQSHIFPSAKRSVIHTCILTKFAEAQKKICDIRKLLLYHKKTKTKKKNKLGFIFKVNLNF